MNVPEGSDSAKKIQTAVERPSDRELVVRRTFDAPARIVFEAWTRPDLLKRWWAPRSFGVTLFEAEADLRVGGTYRYVFGRDPSKPMVFSGVYREIVPGARIVATQIFEPMRQAGEVLFTATFDEKDGKTTLVLHSLYPSKEALDGAVDSGMERGIHVTYDQLDELVRSLV
jgi:uncharacterized protein YndB with AHSA1/START domain